MNGKSPEFPPDFQFIRLRLEKYIFLICEEYDLWTCDQASQVICNIDYDEFTQNDRDNFLITSKILKAKAIAEKIKEPGACREELNADATKTMRVNPTNSPMCSLNISQPCLI